MLKEKSKALKLWDLKEGQVVWSDYFKAYVVFVERDYDDEYIFKYLHKKGYCIIHSSDVSEPEGLIKELL